MNSLNPSFQPVNGRPKHSCVAPIHHTLCLPTIPSSRTRMIRHMSHSSRRRISFPPSIKEEEEDEDEEDSIPLALLAYKKGLIMSPEKIDTINTLFPLPQRNNKMHDFPAAVHKDGSPQFYYHTQNHSGSSLSSSSMSNSAPATLK